MTEYSPASGRNTVAAASRTMNDFVLEAFNQDGSIKENKYPKSVSKWNCTFCPYAVDEKFMWSRGAFCINPHICIDKYNVIKK